MSFEKNIGKQLNFQKELDEAGSREAAVEKEKILKAQQQIMESLKERDDPYEELGPNWDTVDQKHYQQNKEKKLKRKQELEDAKKKAKLLADDKKIKRRNYDNRY